MSRTDVLCFSPKALVMINHIKFQFGSSATAEHLEIDPSAMTIFVGPNNSGKSKAIAEISAQCTGGMKLSTDVIIDSLTFDKFNEADVHQLIGEITVRAPPGQAEIADHVFIDNAGNPVQVYVPHFVEALTNPNGERRPAFSQRFLAHKTLTLNGKNRIDLVNDQAGGDMQHPPTTSFQKLFRNDALRNRYSHIIHKSLNSYAVIDPTNHGQLRLRLSPTAPPSPEIERGLGNASIAFHAAAQQIALASDGAKAFTGILAEILAGDPKVLLMDEPEAFLHPALAFNLGKEVARSLATAGKRMFISTHSPQFLMGCIQTGVPINVVRLTYRGGVATARLLPSEQIVTLMRNPLLRSVGVISALFYESVVVTEADTDRAFYQEINERLLHTGRGIPNCVFLNAQNKPTIPTIVAPLRSLGIPAAAIYDVDFVKDGGGVATKFLEAAGLPELARSGLAATRSELAAKLQKTDSSYKTSGGIAVLSASDQEAANHYFDQLDAYGSFVVRRGELESWLQDLGVTGHGPAWLIKIFEKMGEDPTSSEFVSPTNKDVWKFIDDIADWLEHAERKGIPD